AAVPVVVAVAGPAPPHEAQGEVGEQGHDADHRDGQRRYEDVVVLDVTQLVGQHALQLDPVHLLQQPGRHRHRRVAGIAPGGEGVGCDIVDDVHPGLGQPGGDAESLDEVVQAGV